MIEKLKKDIENIKAKIKTNDENQTKLYELLNNATLQVEEIQQKLEKLQLENQASNNEIKRLEIVKGYLEEVEEKEVEEKELEEKGGTENEQ